MTNKEYESMKKEKNAEDKKASIIVFSAMLLSLLAGIVYIVINA